MTSFLFRAVTVYSKGVWLVPASFYYLTYLRLI
nr:MAG TPA: hypothetical protein [Bacteriophage sp.]